MSVRTPERVRRLSGRFSVVFCSSWGSGAPAHIAPLLGLPDDTPHVVFDDENQLPAGRSWKLPSVTGLVGNEPCAWADDELGDDVVEWAQRRHPPTHLVRCDPRVGLTEGQVHDLLAFGFDLT